MNAADFARLYAYNRWANHRVLACAHRAPPSAASRSLGVSHDSVLGTLVHIMWGEWLWLQRWQGVSPKRVFAPADYPDAAAIEAAWVPIEQEQERWIGALTDERLRATVSYENLEGARWTYPLEAMMQHVANHSAYHRGQVASALRQLGHPCEATDFLVFLDEQG
jgi:uncharacterized damage-inducible protein DinB